MTYLIDCVSFKGVGVVGLFKKFVPIVGGITFFRYGRERFSRLVLNNYVCGKSFKL